MLTLKDEFVSLQVVVSQQQHGFYGGVDLQEMVGYILHGGA